DRLVRAVGTSPAAWLVVVPAGRPSLPAERAGSAVQTIRTERSLAGTRVLFREFRRLRNAVKHAPGGVVLLEDRGWLGPYDLALRAIARLTGTKSVLWVDRDG